MRVRAALSSKPQLCTSPFQWVFLNPNLLELGASIAFEYVPRDHGSHSSSGIVKKFYLFIVRMKDGKYVS